MLKKIIAAAAASTLAVSALAATASAAPAQVVYEGYDVVDYVTVTVKGEVANASSALNLALAAPADKTVEPEVAAVKENYTSIEVAVKNATTKDVKISDGKVSSELTASVSVIDPSKMEWSAPTEKNGKSDASISATTLKKGKDTKATLKTDKFGDPVKITSWEDSKSKITIELTMDLTEAQFETLYAGGLTGEHNEKLTKALKDALEDDGTVSANVAALLSVNAKVKDAKSDTALAPTWTMSDAKVVTKKQIDFSNTYFLDDDATDWSRKDLRQFVNGGKMEFVFNNPVGGKDWVDGAVTFTNANLQNKTVETDYTEETNTVSVEIPANFSYSDNTNTYPWTSVKWEIERKGSTTGTMTDAMKDLKIVKIVFTANESAPGNNGGLVEDDNNKPANSDSTPSSTPSTPSNTNSGSSGNDNKNPSTGVAVAVAPVALAAAAAAVVISKKRK